VRPAATVSAGILQSQKAAFKRAGTGAQPDVKAFSAKLFGRYPVSPSSTFALMRQEVEEADMTSVMSKLLMAALVAAGSVTAMPAVSPAQSLDLYIGRDRDYYGDDFRRERRYDDEDYVRPRGCSTGQALRRAYRAGLRDPEIAAMSRNRIVVEGETRRGQYARIYLANRSGCPRIG
jgi:hypothetical protein